MKPKNIDLTLKIKNYKAGRFLKLYATEEIGDFEKAHPRIIPRLMKSLSIGDPRESLKAAEDLEEILDNFLNSIKVLRSSIQDYMVSQLDPKIEGEGSQFITPDGGIGMSFIPGKEKVTVKTSSDGPKKPTKKPAKKKAPAKKRATKKKAKKEE
jgi:hypothetical protein